MARSRSAAFPLVAGLFAAGLFAGSAAVRAQVTPPPALGGGFATGPSLQVANPRASVLFASPFAPDHLFGDWGGARSWLADHGVQVALDWLSEDTGNVSGGRQQGFRTSGQVGLEVDLDGEKLAGLRGAAFHTMTVNREGRNLSADALGDGLGTTQEIYGGGGNVVAHLVYAYGEQSLLKGRVTVDGGWLPVGTYFAASPLYCAFLNVLMCGNPHPLPNYPGEADWPQASFGGLVRVVPAPQFYLMAGVFSVENDFGTGGGGISGWAWADPHKSGVSVPAELGFVPRIGRTALEGHYKLGFDRDTHRYAVIGGPAGPDPRGRGRTMWYVLADQMLLRFGKGTTDGLIAFGGWVHASEDVSPLAQHAFGGALMSGAPWGRPHDRLGAVWHWIEMAGRYTRAEEAALLAGSAAPLSLDGFGPAYGPQNTEQVAELDYTAAVFRGVTLTPDFQYVIRPGATDRTRNAAVLGFRSNVNF